MFYIHLFKIADMADDSKNVKIDNLPFYSEQGKVGYAAKPTEACIIQEGFKVAREGVNEGVSLYNEACQSVNHVVETGSAHSSAALFQVGMNSVCPSNI